MNDRDITFLEKIQLYKKLKSYLTRKLTNIDKFDVLSEETAKVVF